MLGNSPLVSVVIGSYNHELFVQQTIRSIIEQTYQNIELIIVDDGSTDSTWEKIQQIFFDCDKRFVRVYAKKNPHEGLTANKLISEAQGKYIYSIASDDLAKSWAIEKQVNFLEEHQDYVLVVGDNEFIDTQGKQIGWDKNKQSVLYEKGRYKTFAQFLHVKQYGKKFGTYQNLIKGNHIPNGYLSLASALKSVLPYTKEAPLDDWYTHLQMSKLGKYGFIDEVLFSYRWHENNTAQNLPLMHEMTLKTFLYEKKLVEQKGNEKWKKIFEENAEQIKMKLKIGNIIKFYKKKNIVATLYILEIFGKKIIL